MNALPSIQVACAIIEKEGKVLATQRSATMSLPFKWEFPGGKIEPGESPEDCLRRELVEELGLLINVGSALPPHAHRYETFTVTLYPFISAIDSGKLMLHEHTAIAWLPADELHTLDWAEADLPIIGAYLARVRAATP